MKKAALTTATILTMILAGCGGGGGSDNNSQTNTQPSQPQISTTQANSQATASALGATTISTDNSKEVFDLAADIGDTWRLTVDTKTGNYQVVPNNSQYGVATESGTLTRTVLGNFVNYTLAGKISLYQDLQTKTISGTMTVGSKSASVAGSPYQVANMTALAGTYNFLGTTRDPQGGTPATFLGGQLQINSDGATGTYCLAGTVSSSGCNQIDPAKPTEKHNLTLSKDVNSGIITMKLDGANFGNVFVQAGDRGPVLVVDHYATVAPLTVGNLYAVKTQALQGNEFDGSWLCSYFGNLVGTLKNSGTTINVTQGNSSWQETLTLNKVNGASAMYDFTGMATSTKNGENQLTSGVLVLPLSASLAVIENDGQHAISVCTRMN
ncbi:MULTISPECIES: hypothetical protein [Burkholderiaceae]|jgi:hypothetical protein|uniref:Lipoprotein n=2 Tax=Burkholderiaceae TaxID=119060 RepID=A0A6J5JHC9_9BURK|nr:MULTISPECIES: hypothetical protein [Burkholderiaceae]ANJ73094.1 hypothetical protein A9Y76_11700 [Ralstonia insidiosa]KAB0601843.1 hypothetical protein F7R19_15190 [Cupriavidus pauculus]MBR8498376.1 hypothetical protein [Burkholderia cenocepacia]UAL00276.1 hypothetical protein K8O84_02545 [Cupriavidus pauculus]CAB3970727.1 hypothetical protein BLA3211_06089 [Burkholderia aenigmatica]